MVGDKRLVDASGPAAKKGKFDQKPVRKGEGEYRELIEEIAPIIAAVVDSYGGCADTAQISQDVELQNVIDRIPLGFSRQVKNVLADVFDAYPEFIVPVGDGMVATAIAYDNGAVSTSGVVNKEQLKENHKKAEENFFGPARDKNKGWTSVSGGPAHLEQCRQALHKAVSKPDQWAFESALQKVIEARRVAFGEQCSDTRGVSQNPLGPQSALRTGTAREFLDYLRHKLLKIPAGTEILGTLVNDKEAQRLHKNISDGERRSKLTIQVEKCPEWFIVERDDKGIHVSLTEIGKTEQNNYCGNEPEVDVGKGGKNRRREWTGGFKGGKKGKGWKC